MCFLFYSNFFSRSFSHRLKTFTGVFFYKDVASHWRGGEPQGKDGLKKLIQVFKSSSSSSAPIGSKSSVNEATSCCDVSFNVKSIKMRIFPFFFFFFDVLNVVFK